jgi:bifunctional non-homologous end joining protein LigD
MPSKAKASSKTRLRPVRAKPARKEAASVRRKPASNSPAAYVEPMKALGVAGISGDEWLLEIKYDGFRTLAVLNEGEVELWSRNHKSLLDRFPELVPALKKLKCGNAVVDGEVAALDPEGRPTFQLLQARASGEAADAPLVYYVFDLLHLDGESLISKPIEERRAALTKLVARAPALIRLSPVFDEEPDVLLEAVRKQGLEGIIGKRRGSPYEIGRRSGAWVKKRISLDQEFVIGGYTPPQGGRTHFGALLVGYHEKGKLLYAGKVGTGFNARLLAQLHARFESLRTADCPFDNLPMPRRPQFGTGATAAALRDVTWLEPKLVCQVKFSEWTREGILRQPVFLGLREDKKAGEVVREISER